MTRNADFKAVVRTRMARTGESYMSARAQLLAHDVLHVTNGDAAAALLRDSGLRGDVLPWRDVLHVGPVPEAGAAALRRERARFLAARGWTSEHDAAAQLADRDTTLARHRGTVALWFEADLYDQLQLCQILATLRDLGADPAKITLVCVGEHPGIGHFRGLGELSPPQLAALRGAAETLSGAALDLAALAWAALRAPEPDGYAAIAATVSPELRFVPEAFDRLGREFPSTRDGLSLTERRVLAGAAAGPVSRADVFAHVTAREARPFLGDLPCWWLIDELAAGPRPLLTIDRADGPAGVDARPHVADVVSLTDDGRRVLDGRADRITVHGLDRWIGGVHLSADLPSWRWDEARERVVEVDES